LIRRKICGLLELFESIKKATQALPANKVSIGNDTFPPKAQNSKKGAFSFDSEGLTDAPKTHKAA
jgi:hypothetical protein